MGESSHSLDREALRTLSFMSSGMVLMDSDNDWGTINISPGSIHIIKSSSTTKTYKTEKKKPKKVLRTFGEFRLIKI